MKYAIIGDPVGHSLSPAMHEAGFRYLGIEAEYHRIQVSLSELPEKVEFLKQNGYAGWNVTYPLKERIIPYLDRITSTARDIGAVNTVKFADGLLQGHNTDGEGFVESLKAKGFSFRNKEVVILGAGGAAKAIAVSLAKADARLLILNRTENKADDLAEHIVSLGGNARTDRIVAGDWLKSVDLLIQTTPIGMNDEDYPVKLKDINPSAWVVDLIYHPVVTPFLAEAAFYGCRTFNGLEMLLYQGVLAWKFWLGIEAPSEEMRRTLEETYHR